jgi:hypothetical protein
MSNLKIRGRTFDAWGLALLLGVSCIARASRYPLYPATEQPLPRDRIAVLGGYVARVDGRDVLGLGSSFELLPGCHVVETPTRWGKGGEQGAVVATTGRLVFAVPMRAGHDYEIVVELGPPMGPPVGTLQIRADESDAAGRVVRSFAPVTSSADIDACRRS